MWEIQLYEFNRWEPIRSWALVCFLEIYHHYSVLGMASLFVPNAVFLWGCWKVWVVNTWLLTDKLDKENLYPEWKMQHLHITRTTNHCTRIKHTIHSTTWNEEVLVSYHTDCYVSMVNCNCLSESSHHLSSINFYSTYPVYFTHQFYYPLQSVLQLHDIKVHSMRLASGQWKVIKPMYNT